MVAKATHSPLNIPLCRLNMSLVATNVDCCCKYSEGLELGCRSTQTHRQTEDRWHTVTITFNFHSWGHEHHTKCRSCNAHYRWRRTVPGWDVQPFAHSARWQSCKSLNKTSWDCAAKSKHNPIMHSCMRESALKYGSGAYISCLLHTAFFPFHDLKWGTQMMEAHFY